MRSLLAIVVLIVTTAAALAEVIVSSCGQSIPAGEVARLVGDLDCTSSGVSLGDRATLDLAGFTMRGDSAAAAFTHGVTCAASCTLKGPGSVEGFAGDGLYDGALQGAVRVIGATIAHNHFRGMEIPTAGVKLVNAAFLGNAGEAVYTGARVSAANTYFVGNGAGISGLGVKVKDSTFLSNGVGVNAVGRSAVLRAQFAANGIGVQSADQLTVKSSRFSNNSTGINGHIVKVVATEILDSALDGIDAIMLRIIGSTVTGSGTACTDPRFPCADLATREAPAVVTTTCDRSTDWYLHRPWGVCRLD